MNGRMVDLDVPIDDTAPQRRRIDLNYWVIPKPKQNSASI
jgi:hypothetical protein